MSWTGRGSAARDRVAGVRRGAGGFTLVELLVVVGIIAVLLSILLPSLARAREEARRVVCAANEKQIAAAVLMYANENRGQLPLIVHPWPPGPTAYDAIAELPSGPVDYENGTLWPYLAPDAATRQRLFNCPSDPDPKYFDLGLNPAAPKTLRNLSYVLTGEIDKECSLAAPVWIHDAVTDTTGIFALPLAKVRHADHKVLVVEQYSPGGVGGITDVVNLIAPGNAPGITPDHRLISMLTSRHSGRANIAFFDGHCEPMDPATFTDNPDQGQDGVSIYTPNYAYYVDVYRD